METKTLKRAALALALAATALVAACGAKSEAESVAAARTSLDKKDFQSAVVQLKAALQAHPQSGELRYMLGDTLLKAGDAAAAVVELGKASDLKYDENVVLPRLALAMVASGRAKDVTSLYAQTALSDPVAAAELKARVAQAFWLQRVSDRMEGAINASLNLDPKNVTARLLRARVVAAGGAIDEAMGITESVLAEHPQELEAWRLKGELLWIGKRDPAAGAAAFQEAIKIEPRYALAQMALIDIYMRQGDTDRFRAQVAEFKKVLPQHPQGRIYDVHLALLDKDLKRAREAAQYLLKNAPNSPQALLLAGAVEAQAGALVVAETHYNKALQIEPNQPVVRRELARVYLRLGQPERALGTLQQLLESPRANTQILLLAAEAYLQQDDAAQAEAYFRRAAKQAPDNTQVRTALALTKIARGDASTGFAELESVAESAPETSADLALISSRLRRQDYAGALADLPRLEKKMPDKPMPHLLRGDILLRQKKTAEARASFEQALVADPAYLPAVGRLSMLDVQDNHPERAIQRYQALRERDPRNYRPTLAIAALRERMHAPTDEVLGLLQEAVRTSPTEVEPRRTLVAYLLARKDTKAALTAAREGAAALPDDPAMLDMLGQAQLATGDTEQAISSWGKLAAAQPASPLPLLRLAEAQRAGKDNAAARQSLVRALAMAPNLLPAQEALVTLEIEERHYDDAMKVAKTVTEQRPKNAIGRLLEANVLVAQKRWDPALAALKSAFDHEPAPVTAIRLHAAYATAGRGTDGERFAATWESAHPKDAKFQEYLGAAAMAERNWPVAETHYRKVLAITPDDATALNNLAWVLVQQGKPGAAQWAERAVERAPDFAGVMDTLAAALAADKQYPRAIEWQRKAVAKAPDAPDFRLNLARLLIAAGDKSGARTELETLAKLGDRFKGQAQVAELLKTL